MGEGIKLRLQKEFNVPVDAPCIRPDLFKTLGNEKIKNLDLHVGNKVKGLKDLFEVEGEFSDEITIDGDLSNFKGIGHKMESGKITIRGTVGMHTGAEMSGGKIIIEGNASDWLGAELQGGMIRVKGNAGNLVGAGYRGSKVGMRGGMIIVEGGVGNEVGALMRRGTIAVGNAGDFTGCFATGGSILVWGDTGERTGAFMSRGTIVLYHEPKLLPTFKYGCAYNPVFLRMLLRLLSNWVDVDPQYITGNYKRYSGDITELGKGEILIWVG